MAENTARTARERGAGAVRIGVFAIVSLVALLVASRLESRTWLVKPDGSGDAPTVQAGVDSAEAGDTVLVAPGEFPDTVHVAFGGEVLAVCAHLAKPIVLAGSGPDRTTLGSTAADVVVYVEGTEPGAVVRDLAITTGTGGYLCFDGFSGPPEGKRGILCESSDVLIEGNDIFQNDVGVHLIGSPAEIAGNKIRGGVCALKLEKSSDALVRENEVSRCGRILLCIGSSPEIVENAMHDACDGLWFEEDCSPYVAKNRIVGLENFQAVAISSLSGGTIEDNWIEGADYGVRLYNEWPSGRVVRGNTIFGTQEAVYVHSPNVLVENNTIDRTIVAIYFASGPTYVIRRNIITRAVRGIHADSGDPPVAECNDIFDVSQPYYGMPDQTGLGGNIAVDPEYCGIDDSRNYYLQSDSPCAPGNHPDGYACGRIGAWDVGCGDVAVERSSWGAIKTLFDGGGEPRRR